MNRQPQASTTEASPRNPLLEDWTVPFGVPPFERIHPEHFPPAFAHAFSAHEREVDAIAADREEPTFTNTVEALERSGRLLARIAAVFHVLAGRTPTTPFWRSSASSRPVTAGHWNLILLNEALFRRIDGLHRRREQARPDRASRRACWSAITASSSARARRSMPRQERGSPPSASASRRWPPHFGQNVLADEQEHGPGARGRGRSCRASRTSCAPQRWRRLRASAASPASAR